MRSPDREAELIDEAREDAVSFGVDPDYVEALMNVVSTTAERSTARLSTSDALVESAAAPGLRIMVSPPNHCGLNAGCKAFGQQEEHFAPVDSLALRDALTRLACPIVGPGHRSCAAFSRPSMVAN